MGDVCVNDLRDAITGLVKVFCVGCVFGFFVLFSVIDECWAMCV